MTLSRTNCARILDSEHNFYIWWLRASKRKRRLTPLQSILIYLLHRIMRRKIFLILRRAKKCRKRSRSHECIVHSSQPMNLQSQPGDIFTVIWPAEDFHLSHWYFISLIGSVELGKKHKASICYGFRSLLLQAYVQFTYQSPEARLKFCLSVK